MPAKENYYCLSSSSAPTFPSFDRQTQILKHGPRVVRSPSKEPQGYFCLLKEWSYFGPSFFRLAANLGPGDMQAAICLTPAVADLPSVPNHGCLLSARSVKQLRRDA